MADVVLSTVPLTVLLPLMVDGGGYLSHSLSLFHFTFQGKRVLVVDDVITGGTAIREAFDMLTKAGAVPVGVVIAVDRQVQQ